MYDEKNNQEIGNSNPEGNIHSEEQKTQQEQNTVNFTIPVAEDQPLDHQAAHNYNNQGDVHSRGQEYVQPGPPAGYIGGESRRTDGYGSQYQEEAYRQRPSYSYIPEEPDNKNKPKKQAALPKKIAGITAAALLFGTVAGGTMVGVNWVGDRAKAKDVPETSQSVTLNQPSTQKPEQGGTGTITANPAIVMDVSNIVEKAMPSVVAINNTMLYQTNNWFGPSQTYEVPSSGSGIIIGQNDTELLVVTNNHVVADSTNLKVSFIDNTSVDAAIKGTDSETDLAVLAVPLEGIPSETLNQITVAAMGDSDALKVGQGVIAIGNALGYGQSVTVGYVSALDREVQTDEQTTRNLLQTDAAINPGNSGGALLNMQGEVIGINAAKYSSTEVEGMGYAIPISKANEIINELMNKKTRVQIEEASQGYLGVQGQNIDQTMADAYGMPKGIYVFKIVEGGAAAGSDLREKDIITKFDGQTVRTMQDLKDMLTYYEGGSTIVLTVQSLENGQYVERQVNITLGFKEPVGEIN